MSVIRRLALMLAMYLLVSGGNQPIPWPWPVDPVVVDPAPIPDPGFRVLFTYREATRTQMTPGQKAIWDSPDVRSYLDSHCVKSQNGVPEWRFWTDDQNAVNDSPTMQKMLALVAGKGLMVVISDGKRGTIEPWPADDAAALALLKKYGGA